MSLDLSSERVCYVSCNFCNTILAVNVPYASLFTIVTVRCGHCTNLLSLNMGASLHQTSSSPPPTTTLHQDLQLHRQQISSPEARKECGSSSKSTITSSTSSLDSVDRESPRMPPIRPPPEKRQRVPSAYNRFIKEEIQRIKASNPAISHREAFSTAAKNWAHFPHIHFGLKLDGNKQGKQLDQAVAGQKSNAFY